MRKQIKKNIKKGNRGITLIALVVTIIVLLILAGISIGMLSGNNGILKQSRDAKNQTNISGIKEKIELAHLAALGKAKGEDNYRILKEELEKELGIEGIDWTISPEKNNPWTVTVGKVKYDIENEAGTRVIPLETTVAGTAPYYPSSSFHQLSGTNLTNGLVITDATGTEPGNEYVWIEVPSTYLDSSTTGGPNYSSVTGPTDYANIAAALRTYCSIDSQGYSFIPTTEDDSDKLRSTAGFQDVWYDKLGTTYDGVNAGSQIKHIAAIRSAQSYAFDIAKEYYGKIYTDAGLTQEANSYQSGQNVYYVRITDKLNDTSGCGLTYTEYNQLYKKMLKSIYENGGFWIGRFEAGLTTPRNYGDSTIGIVPQSKINLFPINYLSCSEAQTMASSIRNKGSYNSSLMFGIQWDLVMKHLNNKGITSGSLREDSISIGNYVESEISINRGKYNPEDPEEWELTSWKDYNQSTNGYVEQYDSTYKKIKNLDNWDTAQGILLLTTGASDNAKMMNIYDIAGNVLEYTLEKSGYGLGGTNAYVPSTYRGGSFEGGSILSPATSRFYIGSNVSHDSRI